MSLQEIDGQQVIKLQQALDKIKVNTLYLQLIEEHKEALKCLETMLSLENQYQPLTIDILLRKYCRVMDKIIKLQLQIIFLKK